MKNPFLFLLSLFLLTQYNAVAQMRLELPRGR